MIRFDGALACAAPVVCVGEALWDVTPGGRHPGGAPLNVAIGLASQGIGTRFVTRVGRDAAGRELVSYMLQAGLGTQYVQFDDRHATGRVDVDTSNPEAVHYDIVAPAAWDFIDGATFLEASDGPPGTVVYGSLAARGAVSRRALMQISEQSACRIFDVNLRPPFDDRPLVESLLARADWVKLNEAELVTIAGWAGASGSGDDALAAIAANYPLDLVCTTFGADGAALLYDGTLFRQPGYRVDVVDTIGCGDAFLACLVAGMLRGVDPGRCLRRACAVGAFVATQPGANPSWSEGSIRALTGDAT